MGVGVIVVVMASMVVMDLARWIDAGTCSRGLVVHVGVIEGRGKIVMSIHAACWVGSTTDTSTSAVVFVVHVFDFWGR